MNEQCHFVNLIEGYPDIMSLKVSGRSGDKSSYKDAKTSPDLLQTPNPTKASEKNSSSFAGE